MRNLVTVCIVATLVACSVEPKNSETLGSTQLQTIEVPSQENSGLPYLVAGADGNLYFSWIEKKNGGLVEFNYSKLNAGTWSTPELIAQGDDWFVNWADYPMIAVNQNGDKIAHYLAKSSAGTYSYDVNLVVKPEGQAAWSTSFVPHQDGTPTEHGFVTMIPLSNGSFQTTWLDGRNTGTGGHGVFAGAMTVRSAEITPEGKILVDEELDNRVCDCCQTTGISHSNGPMFFYRDRSEVEIRDISLVRKVGKYWTEPAALHNDQWNIEGCPVNGPRADSKGNNVAVAWYSAASNQPEVKVTFSTDAGESFNDPIIIDQSSPMGRVDIAMISDSKLLVTWLSNKGGQSLIMGRIVSIDGSMEEPFNIAETDESRASGFPQTEVLDNTAYFAWTSLEGDETIVKMKKMILPQ